MWRRREHVEEIGCIYCPPNINKGIRDTCRIVRQYDLNGKNQHDWPSSRYQPPWQIQIVTMGLIMAQTLINQVWIKEYYAA